MTTIKNTIPKDVIEKGKAIIRKQLKEEGLTKQPPVLTINVKEQYDADNDEMFKTGAVSIDLDFIRDGGLQVLQPTALKILLAIASHADKDGFTFVSQQTIAEEVGLRSRQQVAQRINEDLKDIKVGGKVLLKSVMLNKPDGKRFCLYHIVNCKVVQDTYNPDMDEQYDDDYSLDVEDAEDTAVVVEVQNVEPEAIEPEAFIMPEKAVETAPEAVVAPAKPVLNIVEQIRAEAKEKAKDSSLNERQKHNVGIDADNEAVDVLFDSLLAQTAY
ncbi:helix-turn-helix domain-containing protein [Peribacillus sp. NPDC076916]|uniref:helix-turn-helix domain-containing protein n=1 Tax=Peribacillus sp. NPDC076916 TaxID=3390608 RepID=UPI003D05D9F7